ncbi:hypothetical protein [Xenorhabdus szentirmaii]|nr:hypothetical protein [Xenorhabdus sp. 42]
MHTRIMVGGTEQPKGWPDVMAGSSNFVQLTTNQRLEPQWW